MTPTRTGIHIGGADAMALVLQGKSFEELELPHLEQSAHEMFDELAWWAAALKTAREVVPADASEVMRFEVYQHHFECFGLRMR